MKIYRKSSGKYAATGTYNGKIYRETAETRPDAIKMALKKICEIKKNG